MRRLGPYLSRTFTGKPDLAYLDTRPRMWSFCLLPGAGSRGRGTEGQAPGIISTMTTPLEPLERDRPICISVIICNEIINSKRTNNKTLVSLFNGIAVQSFPTVHPRMFVLASLTNGSGTWPISLVVKNPSDKEIIRVKNDLVFRDPLAVEDFWVEVQGLPLTEEGVYFVDVLAGTYPLGNRRFSVKLMAPPA